MTQWIRSDYTFQRRIGVLRVPLHLFNFTTRMDHDSLFIQVLSNSENPELLEKAVRCLFEYHNSGKYVNAVILGFQRSFASNSFDVWFMHQELPFVLDGDEATIIKCDILHGEMDKINKDLGNIILFGSLEEAANFKEIGS